MLIKHHQDYTGLDDEIKRTAKEMKKRLKKTKDNESRLTDLLFSEGETRSEFESFINSLTAVRYSLKRDKHGEYENAVVFHMWTGFCIAKVI